MKVREMVACWSYERCARTVVQAGDFGAATLRDSQGRCTTWRYRAQAFKMLEKKVER